MQRFKKLSLFFTFAGTLFAPAASHAMGHKLFGKACTALYWGIAAGPALKSAIDNIKTEQHFLLASKHREQAQHNPMIQHYADNMFKQKNLPPSLILPGNVTAARLGNVIALKYDKEHSSMQWALSCPQTSEKTAKLAELRGIMQHEKHHLLHNDAIKIISAKAIAPIIAHHALKQIGLFRYLATFHPIGRNVLKIPAASLTVAASNLLFKAYNRQKEQRADEGIEDNIETLQGMANFTRQEAEKWEPFIPTNPLKRKFFELDRTHPMPLARAQRFEDRIAELKKKQNTQNNGD